MIKIKFCLDEKWKTIKDFPNYSISNFGKVKNNKTKQALKQCFNSGGYLLVCLYFRKKRKKRTFLIHRLVAEAFIGLCPKDKEVNHIDGNKANPYVGNLEYVTRSQNLKHAFEIGLKDHKGENSPTSKLTEKNVIRILKLRSKGLTCEKIARKFDIDQTTISDIIRRKTWKFVDRKYLKKNESCGFGEKYGGSKLSDKDVTKIRKIYKEGKIFQKELAKRYGVNVPTISKIVTNRTWKHLL